MRVYNGSGRLSLSLNDVTISVFGLGKMGLPLAAVLADRGATVIGVDIDPAVVSAVENGESPVSNEPGLSDLVASCGGGQLSATTDGEAAVSKADIHILLVPTVVDDDHEPILDPVFSAAESISVGVSTGDLVVLESTVPPGTTDNLLVPAVTPDDRELTPGTDFGVAYCPERTSSGQVIKDLTESYPKIVGGIDAASTQTAAAFYREFNEPGVIETRSTTEAEAIKVFEGVYRDVNIALANELAKTCEEWGIDAHSVFDAANTQPYCDIHQPGVGVGGHCIPVYPHFVTNQYAETPLIETARAVNTSMPGHTVDRLDKKLAANGVDLAAASVLVLGLTYRPGVEELRYAPALDVIDLLLNADVDVSAHDPLLAPETIAEFGAMPVTDPTAVNGIDGIVLATGHKEYADLDVTALREAVDTPVFVDGRDFFDAEKLSAFDYTVIGKPE
jgi:UDP-N-acetyl-D-mannosaminuronic acid dehydrogenase